MKSRYLICFLFAAILTGSRASILQEQNRNFLRIREEPVVEPTLPAEPAPEDSVDDIVVETGDVIDYVALA